MKRIRHDALAVLLAFLRKEENMTIYEIEKVLQNQLDSGIAFDEETGEVYSDLDLDKLISDKMEGYALYIKNMSAEADAIRQEEKNLAERRKRLEKKGAYLKETLTHFMNAREMKKFETPRVAITSRKTSSIDIPDTAKLIDFASKENIPCLKYDIKINKNEVKKHIKELKGYAEIKEGRSFTIK